MKSSPRKSGMCSVLVWLFIHGGKSTSTECEKINILYKRLQYSIFNKNTEKDFILHNVYELVCSRFEVNWLQLVTYQDHRQMESFLTYSILDYSF